MKKRIKVFEQGKYPKGNNRRERVKIISKTEKNV